MKTEIERDDDGRWIAEAPDLAGVVVYGATHEEAIRSQLCPLDNDLAGDFLGNLSPRKGLSPLSSFRLLSGP